MWRADQDAKQEAKVDADVEAEAEALVNSVRVKDESRRVMQVLGIGRDHIDVGSSSFIVIST